MSTVTINHLVNVSSGAFHTYRGANIFMMVAPPGVYGQGGGYGE